MFTDIFRDIVAINGEVSSENPMPLQDCSDGLAEFDEQFHLVDHNDNPLPNISYRVTASTGEIFEGISDVLGFTHRINTRFPENLDIEVFESSGSLTGNVDE